MAFCQKCGKQIEDSANNCPFCGAVNSSNPNATQNNLMEKAKKLNYKNIGILVGGLVVVIILISFIASLFGGGQEKALDNYVNASMYGKEKAVKNLAPKEVWEYIEDEYDVDMDDIYEIFEEQAENTLEQLEDEYGKNIKVSYKIEEVDEVDDDELDDIKDTLKEIGIKKKSVKKAVEAEVEATIKGKEDKDTDDTSMVLVKIGGDWYVYESIEMLAYLAAFN